MIPEYINVNLDVPIEFRAKDEHSLYLINLSYSVVQVMSYMTHGDGEVVYNHCGVHAVSEIKGGLAYFNGAGWMIFPTVIQEKYAEYCAENEILKG